jgi:glycosyltransferase involved in cell wall biosynthesis
MKDLSIIIPTLNESKFLPHVLQAISEQKYRYQIEVIVVDSCSEDETVELARTFTDVIPELTIIESKERGISVSRNLGAARARYEHLLFLDSDVYLPKGFLNALQKKLPDDGDFVALVLHRPPTLNVLDYIWLIALFSFIWLVQWWRPICSGSFLLTTKRNHFAVQGFNEKVIMAEDVLYCHESVKRGAAYKLFFTPSVIGDPRRLREVGRLRLLWLWFKGYLYTTFKGPMYETNKLFDYEFGKHSDNK